MSIDEQKSRAIAFRAMHRRAKILLLPNAWDVISARLFEGGGLRSDRDHQCGHCVYAGYPDGEKISRAEMLARGGRIARVVKVPVTADVEAGYGPRPEDAARTASEVIAAGAVGMNLEDGTKDPLHPLVEVSLHVERIHALREAALKSGVLLVLNARTDVYLAKVGDPEKRYDEAVRRMFAYRDAGADCMFLPGVTDSATIERIVRDLKCPVNILAGPGSPTVPELEKLGVARVSLGSGPMRATLGLVRRMAAELKATGTYTTLEGGIPHAEVNRMLES